jgi:hypothetical protein
VILVHVMVEEHYAAINPMREALKEMGASL